MGDKRTVKVACSISPGIQLALTKAEYDDGTGSGYKPIWHFGPRIRLNGPDKTAGGVTSADGSHLQHGVTEVDAEFWQKWVEQNKGHNAVLDLGAIWMIEEAKEAVEKPTQP